EVRVRRAGRGGEAAPGGGLPLGRRERCTRGRGGLPARRGRVLSEVRLDLGLARTTARDEREQQLPAQVGVHRKALELARAVLEPCDDLELLGGRRAHRRGLAELALGGR